MWYSHLRIFVFRYFVAQTQALFPLDATYTGFIRKHVINEKNVFVKLYILMFDAVLNVKYNSSM